MVECLLANGYSGRVAAAVAAGYSGRVATGYCDKVANYYQLMC